MIAANGLLLLAQQEHTVGNVAGEAYYQKVAMQVRLYFFQAL
jgi:hypothetical protein